MYAGLITAPFVRWYEEPTLVRTYGQQYETYRDRRGVWSLCRRSSSMARAWFSVRVCLRRGIFRARVASSRSWSAERFTTAGAVGRHSAGNSSLLPGCVV